MADMEKGKSCGACHDGKTAFDVKSCITCHPAKDITFKNVTVASQNPPYTEDHSENIQRINWKEVALPATQ